MNAICGKIEVNYDATRKAGQNYDWVYSSGRTNPLSAMHGNPATVLLLRKCFAIQASEYSANHRRVSNTDNNSLTQLTEYPLLADSCYTW
jgi:hypothetical protein